MKKNDKYWQLATYDGFLDNKAFQLVTFKSVKKNDHEHCILCWKTITDKTMDAEHDTAGYCYYDNQINQSYWICKDCFHKFKDRFGWKIIDE